MDKGQPNFNAQGPQVAITVIPFNPSDPRYRCCCGCMHVRLGTYCITILQTVLSFSMAGRALTAVNNFHTAMTPWDYIPAIVLVLLAVAQVVCVVFLMIGVCNGVAKYLTPMIVLLLFYICVLLLLVVLCAVVLMVGADDLIDYMNRQLGSDGLNKEDIHTVRAAIKVVIIILIVLLLINTIFEYWFYRVIKACRSFLEERGDWMVNHPGAQFAAPGIGGGGANVVLIQQPVPTQVPGPYATAPPAGSYPTQGYPPQQGMHPGASGGPHVDNPYANPPPTYNEAFNTDKSAPPM